MWDLRIRPETSLRKIDRFRRKYPSEVARYRSALQIATSNAEFLSAIVRNDLGYLEDWYKSEVEPPISDIKDALRGMGISFVFEQAVKMSAFSIPNTALAVLAGIPPSVVLGGQTLLSFASSIVKVRNDRRQIIAGRPYAYLYRIQRKFGNES